MDRMMCVHHAAIRNPESESHIEFRGLRQKKKTKLRIRLNAFRVCGVDGSIIQRCKSDNKLEYLIMNCIDHSRKLEI